MLPQMEKISFENLNRLGILNKVRELSSFLEYKLHKAGDLPILFFIIYPTTSAIPEI